MPSAKKISSTKSKTAVSGARSQKQRNTKLSGSKAKQNARTAAVAKSKKQAVETRAKAATKRVASATAAKVSKAAKATRTERSKSPARAARNVARPAARKTAAPAVAKTATKKSAKAQATKVTKTEVAKIQVKSPAKGQGKDQAKAQSKARSKASEKQVNKAVVSRQKAASTPLTPVKAGEKSARRPSTGATPQGVSVTNAASDTLVVLAVASTPRVAEPQVRASKPTPVVQETSDQQPVTQKIQKKTLATPVAGVAATAKKAPLAPVPVAAAVKAAAEKMAVADNKAREAKPAALVEETKAAERPVVAPKPAVRPAAVAKPAFKTHEFIVYPAHGVGQIIAIEEQEVAGFKLELFVISFVKDKMILKVPVPKAAQVGMRKLGSAEVVKKALGTLTGRARVKRTMWSRRAQEYEAKINSGDLVAIAEVVRDLYRSEAQPEQSYSERQLYEAALDRVAREIAVVQKLTETESLRLIEGQLQKSPRRGKAEEVESDGPDSDDGDIEEAA